MATTSDGDEGEAFLDQAREIEELANAARASDLTAWQKLQMETLRLALLSLNRIACSLAGIELSYAAICDHVLPEPVVPPLTGEDAG